ncbi:unnamed protein product [Didymodactylos carnosus]|uniref:G-protein coupled receptors family 1 profile domain-containing protein n=1 Tax=Didymodactylos carnosus TaxID=1234261 RepID=A0A815HNP9_9BILA|nr:unnamed protein product [Didymodactylos carnosus]CAF4227961.1 unnamed protein product [Didymodactylos carnosus]
MNTNVAVLLSSITSFILILQSLLGDFSVPSFIDITSPVCSIPFYLFCCCSTSIYYSYCLQSLYRLCRVIFYKYKYFQKYSLYIVLCILKWLFSFLIQLPPLLWNYIIYLPNEFYCIAPMFNLKFAAYVCSILYGLSITIISLIYVWIIYYIKQQSSQTLKNRQNQRDLIIIKRILITLGILIILGIPIIVFILLFILTNYWPSFAYRLIWMTISFSFLFLNLSLIYFTSQWKQSVKQLWNNRRRQRYILCNMPVTLNLNTVKHI